MPPRRQMPKPRAGRGKRAMSGLVNLWIRKLQLLHLPFFVAANIRRLVMRRRAQRAQRDYNRLRTARMQTLRGLRVTTNFNTQPSPFMLAKSAGGTLRLCTSLMPAAPQATVPFADAPLPPPLTLSYENVEEDAGGYYLNSDDTVAW